MFSENYIKELQRLYPKIKIPIYEKHQYYIDCLLKDNGNKNIFLKAINELSLLESKLNGQSITSYKLEKFNEIVQDFKEKRWIKALSELDLDKLFDFNFSSKNFNNWDEKKIYISIDIKEANWSVYKRYVLEEISDTWADFVTTKYNLDPALANSKSLRQFILGNTNPNKLNRLSELSIHQLFIKIQELLPNLKMVMKSADEVIFELDDNFYEVRNTTYLISTIVFRLPIKYTIFKIEEKFNFKELVRIKNIYDEKTEVITKSELINVPGNRFFLHFKTLILKEKIHENDLLFTLDNKTVKWVIDLAENQTRELPTISKEST